MTLPLSVLSVPSGREHHTLRDPSSSPPYSRSPCTSSYHMHFQSQGGSARLCPGAVAGEHTWGHATSADMVTWTEHEVTCIQSSSGGGIALDPGALGNFTAAALGSSPTASGPGAKVGLELWLNDDPALLAPWRVHDAGDGCYGTTTKAGAVICPSMVPPELDAGYIGDNYFWQTGAVGNRTYFLLSGSTVCAPAAPWCGYPHGKTPMALLFSSRNLLDWRFATVWYRGEPTAGLPGDDRLDVPDTFELPDGRQAFIWLTSSYSVYSIGAINASTGAFEVGPEGSFDVGALFCQQSFTTPDGRRVSVGWIRSTPATQSLAREIVAVGDELHFRPIAELTKLNGDIVKDANITLGPDAAEIMPAGTPAARITLLMQCAAAPVACEAAVAVGGTVVAIARGDKPRQYVLTAGSTRLPFIAVSAAPVKLDLFVDSTILEVFAGDGARALTLIASSAGGAIAVSGKGGAIAEVKAWPLRAPSTSAAAPPGRAGS